MFFGHLRGPYIASKTTIDAIKFDHFKLRHSNGPSTPWSNMTAGNYRTKLLTTLRVRGNKEITFLKNSSLPTGQFKFSTNRQGVWTATGKKTHWKNHFLCFYLNLANGSGYPQAVEQVFLQARLSVQLQPVHSGDR
jgi:hypothetical protein